MFTFPWFTAGAERLQGLARAAYLSRRLPELVAAAEALHAAGCSVEVTDFGLGITPPEDAVPFDTVEPDDPHAAIQLYLERLGVREQFVFPAVARTATDHEVRYLAVPRLFDEIALSAATPPPPMESLVAVTHL